MTILRVTRREFIATLGSAAAWPMVARGQQPPKVFHIGYLGYSPPPLEQNLVGELRQGLRDLGYVEGQNVAIEYRSANGNVERLPELATELVALNVDVIVTLATTGALAAKQATRTIQSWWLQWPILRWTGLWSALRDQAGILRDRPFLALS